MSCSIVKCIFLIVVIAMTDLFFPIFETVIFYMDGRERVLNQNDRNHMGLWPNPNDRKSNGISPETFGID